MPEMGPARTFVAPMKAEPGFIPDPIKQSTTAPLLSGISSAAGSLASVDWGNAFGGGGDGTTYGGSFGTDSGGYTAPPLLQTYLETSTAMIKL